MAARALPRTRPPDLGPRGAQSLGGPGRAAFGGGRAGGQAELGRVLAGLCCGPVEWGKVKRGAGIAVGPGNKQQLAGTREV